MLNQIIAARAVVSRCGHDLAHRVELMITREDHRFLDHNPLAALAVVHLLLLLFDEHEVAENIEETVELKHVLPKITRAIAGLMLRIARAALNLARMTPA